ncbi:MAG: OmpA family protein [Opitutae bacterium]|nr:OmpA family protein [Opitutae bacterium]
MKIAVKLFALAAVSAALVLTGCSKKPTRPMPGDTVTQTGTGQVTPVMEPTAVDPNSQLTQRTDGVIEDQFTIRGLLKAVYFDFDKSAIKQSERPKLEAAAKYLKEHPEHRLLLEGRCDWRGTAEYNLGLGDRRAGAAKDFLAKLGVEIAKLETTSKGSLEAAKNGTEAQMTEDRRVELVILKK